jgi:Flp pilus assembly protein TadD
MTPGIPDNLLEGDVVYLPWEKVGAKEHVPPGGAFHWPHETPFAVLAERVDVIRNAGRMDQNDLYHGMLRSLLLHPHADTADAYRSILLGWQPDLEHLLRKVGVGWANSGELERGCRYLRLATIVAPGAPEGWHDLGVCLGHLGEHYRQAGDLGRAEKTREESVRCHAESNALAPELDQQTWDLYNLDWDAACAALKQGNSRVARDGFWQATQRQPDNYSAWFFLGVSHRTLGDFKHAVTALTRAAELVPENPVVRNECAMALALRRSYGTAEEHLRAAVALKPDDKGYLCNLALILMEQGRLPEAEETLNQAAQLSPADRTVDFVRKELERRRNPFYRLYRKFSPLRDEGWKKPFSGKTE